MVELSDSAPPRWVCGAARVSVLGVAAAVAAVAYALYTGAFWVIGAWPWPETHMSFVFLASIAASVCMVWLSIGLTGELAALAGVGVNIVVASFGACVFLAQQAWTTARGDLALAVVASAVSCAFGVLLWRWARRLPVRDPRSMPLFVRWAFIAFVVTLVVAGSALALQMQVFPWRLQDQTATLFGFVFLGAAAYFAHAVARARWAFGAPPLWGFLAYDLVLFVPYSKLLLADPGAADDIYGSGEPVNRTGLVIYLTVLSTSALLALYAMFLHPATRLWGARPANTK